MVEAEFEAACQAVERDVGLAPAPKWVVICTRNDESFATTLYFKNFADSIADHWGGTVYPICEVPDCPAPAESGCEACSKSLCVNHATQGGEDLTFCSPELPCD